MLRFGNAVQPLTGDQLGKEAVLFDQLLISAVLNDLSLIQNDDPVALPDGRQAVRDDDSGTLEAVQGLRNLFLRQVVQRARCFIKSFRMRRIFCPSLYS